MTCPDGVSYVSSELRYKLTATSSTLSLIFLKDCSWSLLSSASDTSSTRPFSESLAFSAPSQSLFALSLHPKSLPRWRHPK